MVPRIYCPANAAPVPEKSPRDIARCHDYGQRSPYKGGTHLGRRYRWGRRSSAGMRDKTLSQSPATACRRVGCLILMLILVLVLALVLALVLLWWSSAALALSTMSVRRRRRCLQNRVRWCDEVPWYVVSMTLFYKHRCLPSQRHGKYPHREGKEHWRKKGKRRVGRRTIYIHLQYHLLPPAPAGAGSHCGTKPYLDVASPGEKLSNFYTILWISS